MIGHISVKPDPPTAIVIDGFYMNPHEVREYALSQNFIEDNSKYRGRRSDKNFRWPGIKERFESLIDAPIAEWEQHGFNGVFQYCVGGDQVVFHSDMQRWAGVVYLTPDAPPESGTTLYRSKANKLRAIHEAKNSTASRELLERQMYHGKLLDKTAWEQVDVFGNVFNRLVIWDARLVHAASCYFGSDKNNGRLFQMFFFS